MCTTPEHQASYVVADVGRVVCPICQTTVPSPRPQGPLRFRVGLGEHVEVQEHFGPKPSLPA